MLRVALLSRWHPHAQAPDERYAKELLKNEDCAVTCVWDPDPAIAREWGEQYGVPYETELMRVLTRDDVDGVLVTSDAASHREILIAAAEHGKHIFTEKVLAFTLEDALAIRDAVKRSGVKFCISFNRLAIRQLAYAKSVLESGRIGRPVLFRCLCAHAQGVLDTLPPYFYEKKVAGGGAMIDMGFNSAYLARYVMGDVESVSSTFSSSLLGKEVEDTASASVIFRNGAIGQIDATFCSPAMSVFELALYGTEGAYYARFGGGDVAELRLAGKPPEALDPKALPKLEDSPIGVWISACTKGASDALYGIDAAVDAVRFMLAAYASHEQNGRRVKLVSDNGQA